MPQLLKLLALTLIWWSSNIVEYFFFAADILGATELKGPVSFEYKDLKAGTKNFSADNKPWEGSFGTVYKKNFCCIFQYYDGKHAQKTMSLCECFFFLKAVDYHKQKKYFKVKQRKTLSLVNHTYYYTGYSEKWKSCCCQETSVGEIKKNGGWFWKWSEAYK